MASDIHAFVEIKKEGKWMKIDKPIFLDPGSGKLETEPFNVRNYTLFGFLADVRNHAAIPVIVEPIGLPKDSEYLNSRCKDPSKEGILTIKEERAYWAKYGEHNHSFITLKEFLDFDYKQEFENQRLDPPEKMTVRTTLEKSDFFEVLEALKTLGKPESVRVVFYFDN